MKLIKRKAALKDFLPGSRLFTNSLLSGFLHDTEIQQEQKKKTETDICLVVKENRL